MTGLNRKCSRTTAFKGDKSGRVSLFIGIPLLHFYREKLRTPQKLPRNRNVFERFLYLSRGPFLLPSRPSRDPQGLPSFFHPVASSARLEAEAPLADARSTDPQTGSSITPGFLPPLPFLSLHLFFFLSVSRFVALSPPPLYFFFLFPFVHGARAHTSLPLSLRFSVSLLLSFSASISDSATLPLLPPAE